MSHFHAAVWLDHAEARVFQFNPDDVQAKVVHAAGNPHGAAHGSPKVHHKAGVIGPGKAAPAPGYFAAVAKALDGAGEVLVMGPGTAKDEFARHLAARMPALAHKVVAVETADRMTDHQIVAQARKHFAKIDRTLPQRG